MERRQFIELLGLSSMTALSGCNGILLDSESGKDNVTTNRAPDGAFGTSEDPFEQPVEVEFENIMNSFYFDGDSLDLSTRLFLNIRNEGDIEAITEIDIEIDELDTIERTVPVGSSDIIYSTDIETEGEYTVALDGESVAEIDFTPPSIAHTYQPDGVGQSTPNDFGVELQEIQKIEFEASAIFESSTLDISNDARCYTLDFCVAGDLLYVYNEWRTSEVNTEHSGYSVHGIDVWDSEERWSLSFGKNLDRGPGPGLLSVSEEYLYYLSPDGIHAVTPESGEEQWSVTVDRPRKILLYDDTLFVNDGGSLYALHSITGERKWGDETVGAQRGAGILAASTNEAIIKTNGSPGIHSVDISDGSLNWTFDSFSEPGLSNECAYSNSKVFVTADVGFNPEAGAMGLYCLDAKTGEQIWRNPISRSYELPDVAVIGNRNDIIHVDSNNGLIYVDGSGRDDFGLQCFDIPTGELVWRADLLSKEGGRNSIHSAVKGGEFLYGKSGSLSRIARLGHNHTHVELKVSRLVRKNQIGSNDEQLIKELPPVFAQGLLFYAYEASPRNYVKVFSGKKPSSEP